MKMYVATGLEISARLRRCDCDGVRRSWRGAWISVYGLSFIACHLLSFLPFRQSPSSL